jgi:cytochrome c oxidase cbb3-type subunit III
MTTDNIPAENQQEDYELDTLTNNRLLKDHEYDGIRELDNGSPSWFNWLFILTIIFAIVYLVRLWVFKADDLIQEKEFDIAMSAAKPKPSATTEADTFQIVLLTDEASLENGKKTYESICAACHLKDGGGIVGPNFTDQYWIHGNTIADMYRITTEGVIKKGMIPYKDQLSPVQRLEVNSYILQKLVGTTPAMPKAPEGELFETNS